MEERALSLRELNRATLERQLLIEPKPLSPQAVIEHLAGMQAQSPQAPYIGIWTRTTSFRRPELEDLLETGEILKATVMRMTLHLVTRHDYALMRAALSETNFYEQEPIARRLAPLVRQLAADETLLAKDALAYLEREHGLTGKEARYAWRGARVRAHLLPHHETALWSARGPITGYMPIEEPEDLDPTEARAELLRRYLAAFGPASPQDIRAWSMMRAAEIRRALDRLEPLVRFRDENGRQLLDIPDGLLPGPDTDAPVRLLPKWDNLLVAYADRSRILPEPYRRKVIGMNGHVDQTFLVDGFVAGTWRIEDNRAVIDAFETLSRQVRHDLDQELERVRAFVKD